MSIQSSDFTFVTAGDSFYAVHIIALIIISLSFLGGCLIIFLSLCLPSNRERLCSRTREISLGARLPFVLATSDVSFAIVQAAEHILFMTGSIITTTTTTTTSSSTWASMMTSNSTNNTDSMTSSNFPSHLPSSGACTALGLLMLAAALNKATLTWCTALHTYWTVARNMNVDAGKYDWKLYVLVWTIETPVIGVSAALQGFGPNEYFCFFTHQHDIGIQLEIFACAIVFSMELSAIFFHSRIIRKLKSSKVSSFAAVDQYGVSTNDIIEKSTRKVLGFVAVFIAQWVFLFPYAILYASGLRSSFLFIVLVVTVNCGGFLNCILFVYKISLEQTAPPSINSIKPKQKQKRNTLPIVIQKQSQNVLKYDQNNVKTGNIEFKDQETATQ